MHLSRIISLMMLPMIAITARADEILFLEMMGHWESDQPVFGSPAHTRLDIQSTLDNKFMRLDYSIESELAEGQRSRFEGVAYYRRELSGEVAGFWADNSGFLHPIRIVQDEHLLTATWGEAGAKQGRTEYRIIDENTISTTDWILAAEGWRQFNQNEYRRSKD